MGSPIGKKKKERSMLFKWLWKLGEPRTQGSLGYLNKKYKPTFINGLPIFDCSLLETWADISSIVNSSDPI